MKQRSTRSDVRNLPRRRGPWRTPGPRMPSTRRQARRPAREALRPPHRKRALRVAWQKGVWHPGILPRGNHDPLDRLRPGEPCLNCNCPPVVHGCLNRTSDPGRRFASNIGVLVEGGVTLMNFGPWNLDCLAPLRCAASQSGCPRLGCGPGSSSLASGTSG